MVWLFEVKTGSTTPSVGVVEAFLGQALMLPGGQPWRVVPAGLLGGAVTSFDIVHLACCFGWSGRRTKTRAHLECRVSRPWHLLVECQAKAESCSPGSKLQLRVRCRQTAQSVNYHWVVRSPSIHHQLVKRWLVVPCPPSSSTDFGGAVATILASLFFPCFVT